MKNVVNKCLLFCVIVLLFVTVLCIKNLDFNILDENIVFFEYDNLMFNLEKNNDISYLKEYIKGEPIVLVFETKDLLDLQKNKNSNDTVLAQQKYVFNNRQKIAKFYGEKNFSYLKNISWINYDEIYVSKYSPFITIKINDSDNFLSIKNIDKLKQIKNTKKITIVSQTYNDINYTIADDDYSPEYDFIDALEDCGLGYSSYDGTGINIGIIELGVANSSNVDFGGKMHIKSDYTYDSNDSWCIHATICGLIACSNYGVATGSNIYSTKIPILGAVLTLPIEIDWLIDNNVNVVNMSYGNYNQTYTVEEAIIDYYARNTFLCFVVAAGNNGGRYGTQDGAITNPALAYNVITVGAVDANNELAEFSSYVSSNSRKVTIVAPGVKLKNISPNCPYMDTDINNNPTYTNSGTSFSAPIVTGTIAVLMEEMPGLISEPEAIISLLVASANQDAMSGIWDSYAGGGLLNYDNAALSAISTTTFSLSYDNVGNAIAQQTIAVVRGQDVRVSIAWLINSQTNNAFGNAYNNILTDFDVKVYDSSNNLISYCTNSYSNIEVLEFYTGSSGSLIKSFTIKVFQVSARPTGNIQPDIGAISHYYVF